MTDALSDLATVLDENARHDCATLTVEYPRGEFKIQFATGTPEPGAVWNIAANPPGAPPETFDILDGADNYVLVASEATTAEWAEEEARVLIEEIAPDGEVVDSSTFEMFKGVRDLAETFDGFDIAIMLLLGLAGTILVGSFVGPDWVFEGFILGVGIAIGTAPWWSMNFDRRAA